MRKPFACALMVNAMSQIAFIGICPKCMGARIQFVCALQCRIFVNQHIS